MNYRTTPGRPSKHNKPRQEYWRDELVPRTCRAHPDRPAISRSPWCLECDHERRAERRKLATEAQNGKERERREIASMWANIRAHQAARLRRARERNQ